MAEPARPDPPIPPREALADVRVRAPTRGNRRLEKFLDAVNADDQVKAWWHVSAVNATRRLSMSDHSWVHIQIVLNIGLRLGRLLFRRGVTPSVTTDYGMSERDAEVVQVVGPALQLDRARPVFDRGLRVVLLRSEIGRASCRERV